MQTGVPKSVEEYIAAQPKVVRPKLEQIRAAIQTAVPEAVEGIGYPMPAYKLQGKPMLYFAGFKEHYSLVAAPGTFWAAVEDELKGYDLRKEGAFPPTKPVPIKLVSRIAKLRVAEIAEVVRKQGRAGRKQHSSRQSRRYCGHLARGSWLQARDLPNAVWGQSNRICSVPIQRDPEQGLTRLRLISGSWITGLVE